MKRDRVMPQTVRDRILVIVAIGFVILTASQCSRGGNQASSGESKMTALYPGDETIMNYDYWSMEAAYLIFIPLVAINEDRELVPRLAERWEHSDDYREWTFWLRRDVRWHDGKPTTAHDVKFTRDVHKKIIMDRWGIEDPWSVTVLDDYSFKIVFDKPSDALDDRPIILPKHLVEHLDPKEFYSWEFWNHPVGNGPYRYLRHVPKTMAEYEANPDYYQGRPKIDRIVLKFGSANELAELLSGNVDVANPSAMDVLKLKDDSRFHSYHAYETWMDAIYWNHKNPLFREAAARRALTLAINRRELGTVLNYPEDVSILDVTASQRQFRSGHFPEPLPYDPDEAGRLLQNLGWKDADKNGVLEKDGREFHFTAVLPSGSKGHGMGKAAVFIQQQYKKIGVKMEIQTLQNSVVKSRFTSGDFEAAFFRFLNCEGGLAYQDDYFGEKSPFGYANPELVEYVIEARYTIDPQKKDSLFRKMMSILLEDIPVTLLFPRIDTAVVNRRIKGLSNIGRWDPVRFAEYLWIEEEN